MGRRLGWWVGDWTGVNFVFINCKIIDDIQM